MFLSGELRRVHVGPHPPEAWEARDASVRELKVLEGDDRTNGRRALPLRVREARATLERIAIPQLELQSAQSARVLAFARLMMATMVGAASAYCVSIIGPRGLVSTPSRWKIA